MNKYLPSKKFAKFIGIFLGLGLVVWLLSFLVLKKESYKADSSKYTLETSGDQPFYEVDTDKDGLKDWEEALWLTDPNSPDSDSDGISDKDEIEKERDDIKAENGTLATEEDSKDLSQTDVFARQFFSTVALANQRGGVTEETIASFGAAFGDAMKESFIEDQFTLSQIHLSGATRAQYQTSLQNIFNPLSRKNIDEIAVINSYITTNGDAKSTLALDEMITVYQGLASSLSNIKVPYNAANIHLSMLNNAVKIGIGFVNLKNIKDDPLVAVVGLNQFIKYSKEFQKDLDNLKVYFGQSGIMSGAL